MNFLEIFTNVIGLTAVRERISAIVNLWRRMATNVCQIDQTNYYMSFSADSRNLISTLSASVERVKLALNVKLIFNELDRYLIK